MDGRTPVSRSPALSLRVRRSGANSHLCVEHRRADRALDDRDAALLELAWRDPALDLPDDSAQRRRAMEPGHDLGLTARHVPHRAWHLPGCRAVRARIGRQALALSRAALLAPYGRARIRPRRAHLGRERTGFDEPV